MTGTLTGIAIRPERKAPMRLLEQADITTDGGVVGDHAGKFPDRLVTVMTEESWNEALAALNPPLAPGEAIDWTTRRANLLTKGVDLPRAEGGVIQIGEVVLEVTGQTWPCKRMEEARAGLLKALAKDWRGGVTCKVHQAGHIALEDPVEILVSPPEVIRKLPG